MEESPKVTGRGGNRNLPIDSTIWNGPEKLNEIDFGMVSEIENNRNSVCESGI